MFNTLHNTDPVTVACATSGLVVGAGFSLASTVHTFVDQPLFSSLACLASVGLPGYALWREDQQDLTSFGPVVDV